MFDVLRYMHLKEVILVNQSTYKKYSSFGFSEYNSEQNNRLDFLG